jgi:hypothetical protein
VYKEAISVGLKKKLSLLWKGPMEIIKQKSNLVYVVKEENGTIHKVNVDKMKKFKERSKTTLKKYENNNNDALSFLLSLNNWKESELKESRRIQEERNERNNSSLNGEESNAPETEHTITRNEELSSNPDNHGSLNGEVPLMEEDKEEDKEGEKKEENQKGNQKKYKRVREKRDTRIRAYIDKKAHINKSTH